MASGIDFDRSEIRIRRQQAHAAAAVFEVLDRDFVVEPRHDDATVFRARRAVHRDQVAIEDAGIAHAEADDAQQVIRTRVEQPRIEWQPVVIWTVVITGLLCTAVAFTIQAWAQRFTTNTRTAIIYALEPVVAWITSYWLVGEGLSARGAAGAGLILSGVFLVEMKPFQGGKHLSK